MTREIQLLGQSGKTIYSAAIRLQPDLNAIDFDLCARLRDLPVADGFIGSTYEFSSDLQIVSAETDLLDFRSRTGDQTTYRLTLLLVEQTAELAVPKISAEDHRFSIGWDSPPPLSDGRGLSLRWCYRLAAIESSR